MNRPINPTTVILAIGLVAFTLFLVWLVPKIETYTETEELGYSLEARRNPYLAAQNYLQKLGKPASTSDSLESMRQLPDIGTGLVIDDISQVLSEQRSFELLEWVRSGGRLTMGTSALDEDDLGFILDSVELEVFETKCDCGGFDFAELIENSLDEQTAEKNYEKTAEKIEETDGESDLDLSTGESDEVPEYQLTKMQVSGQDEELSLYFDPNWALHSAHWDWLEYAGEGENYYGYEPSYWAGSAYGEHLIQFEIGDGLLTVLSDETIWYSAKLTDYDHAYLLWALHRRSDEVMFVYGSRMPGIFTLLWRSAPELVVSFLLILFAWLIYKGRRFGPVAAEVTGHRRALIEHQRAVGQFIWNRGQAVKVIELMRADLLQRLHKLHPEFETKTPAQQGEFLEQKLNVPAQKVKLALYTDETPNDELFTEVAAAIQMIRNRL